MLIPRVPGGGGSGTTATGQPTARSSDSASGETSFLMTGSATDRPTTTACCASGLGLDAGHSHVGGGNLFCKRYAHPLEIHVTHHCAYVARINGPNKGGQVIQRPS